MTYRYKKALSNRQLRVAELIMQEISLIISRSEIEIPILENGSLTISNVKISPDLKIATAFVNIYNNNNNDEIMLSLNSIAYKFREKINARLHLKHSPEIRFAKETDTFFIL